MVTSRVVMGLALAGCMTAASASADFPIDLTAVVGMPVVHEAAVLEINGLRLRLDGIAALAPGDRCVDGHPWRCGEYARDLMAGFLANQRVRCRLVDRRDDIWHARCSLNRIDLQAFLVSRGLAEPQGRAGGLYADLAKRAKERRGPIYTRASAITN